MLDLILNDAKQIINTVDFSKLKGKSILITGASGLIGLNLLAPLKLLKDELKLTIYCWVNNDIDNKLKPLFDGCSVFKSDITNIENIKVLQNIFAETLNGIDFIIHAAGYAQPQKFMSNKLKTIELNTKTINDLMSLLNPDGSFLYCSSSEIYSGLDQENITETQIGTTTPNHPRACYIESKRCGEAICNSYDNNVKIARISTVYGPGTKQNDTRVLNNLIQKGLQTGTINLLDDGSSVRTLCYSSDISEMLWNILLHGKDKTYNVAGIFKLSILELANKISTIINCTVSLPERNNELLGNPKVVDLSIDKYLKEFKNKTFKNIEFGLNTTINWQKFLYN